jgi:HlyD family secretion protein
MTRTKLVAASLAALCALGLGYYVVQKQAAADPEKRYKTQALAKGDVTQTVSANGTLNPVTLVSVGTQVSGTVKKLHVDFNDQVKAGPGPRRARRRLYSAQVRQSEASIASARPALRPGRASEARLKSLFAAGIRLAPGTRPGGAGARSGRGAARSWPARRTTATAPTSATR